MSAGSYAPALCRRVMTVVGSSCRLALSNASSIARARRPVSPRPDNRLAASIPAGVAAFPSPRRFAERFIEIASHAASSSRPGNKGRSRRRNIFPSRAASPVSARISISPLHSVIVASSVISSFTACSPLESNACAAWPVLPVTADSTAESNTSNIHIFPTFITFTFPHV